MTGVVDDIKCGGVPLGGDLIPSVAGYRSGVMGGLVDDIKCGGVPLGGD